MPLLPPASGYLSVGCTLHLQLFLHFVPRVPLGFWQRLLIFPRIYTRHHASTRRPNTGSPERRCHMPTCFRTRFLGQGSSSTRNKRRVHPERIQDTNC